MFNNLPQHYNDDITMRELDMPLLQYLLQRGTTHLRTHPAVDLWAAPRELYLDASTLGQPLLPTLLQQVEVQAPLPADHSSDTTWLTQQPIALGYPLVRVPDPQRPGQSICAPLLLWSLNVASYSDGLSLCRTGQHSIRFNEALATYLRPDALYQEPPLPDMLLQDQRLDACELLLVLQRTLQYLAPQQLLPPLLEKDALSPLKPLPTPNHQELGLALYWSGVLAPFPPQQGAILRDLKSVLNNYTNIHPLLNAPLNPSKPNRSAFMKHSFTVLPTDPCQQELLQDLHRGAHIRLQIPPHTGGDKTLSGLLANVLTNAGTALVVSDTPEELNAIQQHLQALGLGELIVHLDDSVQCRQALFQSIRQRATQQHAPYQVSASFIQLLQTCSAQVEQLQAFAKKLQTPLLDQYNWTAVVGELLKARAAHPESLLQGKLQPRRFNFTPTEYATIKAALPQAQSLFKRLGSLQSPLNVLHDRFFERSNAVEMEKTARTAVEQVLHVVQKAQRDAYAYLFEYEQVLEQYFGKVYTTKMAFVERIVDDIKIGLANSKYHFNRSEGFYRNLMKRMSDKHQQYEEQKVAILETFYQLQRFHLIHRYFSFTFLDTSNSKKLVFTDLLKHVEEYKAKLYEWQEGLSTYIQQLVRELGPQQIYPHVTFDRQVRDISRNLKSFERNFVDSQVFKVGFAFQSNTIRKCLTQIEGLEHNLERLKETLEDFQDYHALKYFWLSMDPLQRQVVEALIELEEEDWLAAFATWYLDVLLMRYEDEQVPDERRYQQASDTLRIEHEALRQRLIPHTLSYWRGKQTQASQAFHRAQSPLTVGALYASGGQRSLRSLIATDPDLFFSFFPIVLTNPTAVAALLPLQIRNFDLGLVLGAHRLSALEGLPTLLRSQYHLITGDSTQTTLQTPINELSIVSAGLSATALPLAKAHNLLAYVHWLPRFQARALRLQPSTNPQSPHCLTLLHSKDDDPPLAPRPHSLEEELVTLAKAAFPQLTVALHYQWKGMPADLALPTPEGPPKAVFYLDTYSEGDPESVYAWDLFLGQYWTALGVRCYRLWSKEWWQQPEQAAERWRTCLKENLL